MFHIEQAMQLILKAKLMDLKGYYERTHSLRRLLGSLMASKSFSPEEPAMGRVRADFFKNYRRYLSEMVAELEKHLDHFEVYVFGSILKGNYSVGLSDMTLP